MSNYMRALFNAHKEPVVMFSGNKQPVFLNSIFKQQELFDGAIVLPQALKDDFEGLIVVHPPSATADSEADFEKQAQLYIRALEWYVSFELVKHGFYWDVMVQP